MVLWFTGLPGAGKSTLAHAVEERLFLQGCYTFVFDGDNVRHGLCSDLGFSPAQRSENLRRIGEMAKLFVEAGIISLAAFVSPSSADRERLRGMFAPHDFAEVYCNCPLVVCEQRDTKGMYRRARAGEIPEFTGVSAPYEMPLHADLVVDTANRTLNVCVEQVLEYIGRAQRWNGDAEQKP
jgi:adenylylsulfate kinase